MKRRTVERCRLPKLTAVGYFIALISGIISTDVKAYMLPWRSVDTVTGTWDTDASPPKWKNVRYTLVNTPVDIPYESTDVINQTILPHADSRHAIAIAACGLYEGTDAPGYEDYRVCDVGLHQYNIGPAATIGELESRINQVPVSNLFINSWGLRGRRPCLEMYIVALRISNIGDGVLTGGTPPSNFLRHSYKPGGAPLCVKLPPPEESCSFMSPTVTLDYGDISLAQANGSTASAPVSIQCTAAMKYIIKSTSGDSVPLSNGMSAMLGWKEYTNWGAEMEGKAGINHYTLTSELRGTPTKSGAFNGSTVLTIYYP